MTTFRRFAIYWAPPAGSDFARFGAAWLGWDAESGRAMPHPDVPGLSLPIGEITATPRRYGFHATLKAPFRPVDPVGVDALDAIGACIADTVSPFEAPPLAPTRLGRFVALVPSGPCPELQALADCCVSHYHHCAAVPDSAEFEKRRAAKLTFRQEQLMARWFYPYVFDEFRFHLTLTGPLPPEHAGRTFETVMELTAPFCAAPLPVVEFCLSGEDEAGFFHFLRRYRLSG